MPANRFGIDMADIYRTETAVKGARTQNKLAALNLQEKEREIAGREEKAANAAAKEQELIDLRLQSVGGDRSAQAKLMALAPSEAPQFLEGVAQMNERQREAAKRSVEEMGQLSSYVLQGGTPEERQRRYQVMYAGVSPEVQAKLPSDYDDQFMELSLSKALTMEQILENPKSITVGDTDKVYKGGRLIDEGKKPVNPTGGSGDLGGLKSSDENLIYKQTVELLGGLFDDQGNVQALDPKLRGKVQGITTEAANIFRQGKITRSEAVKRAAQKYGVDVQEVLGQQDQSAGQQYPEGTRIRHKATGQILVMQNGKWVTQ